MSRLHPERRRKFFTLVELLVVIAIISLLAALLFPALGLARGMAQRICCLNNFKQIGIGILSYKNDAGDHMPYNPKWNCWQTFVDEYIGGKGADINNHAVSAKVWACPQNNPTGYNALRTGACYWSAEYCGYVGNTSIYDDPKISGPQSVMAKNLSSLIMAEEAKDINGNTGPVATLYYAIYGFSQYRFSKHAEGSNFLFFDAHAEWRSDNDPARSADTSIASKCWIPQY